MTKTRRFTAVALVVAMAALVGCGGDDEDASSASASGSGSGSTAEDEDQAAGEGDLETYCAKSAEIEILLNGEPEIDFETASPEEIAEALKSFAGQGVPIAEEIQASVPEENRENVDVLVAALSEVAETGEFEAFESPEVEAAGDADHTYAIEQCGWNVVDVTATNYAFDGIDAEMPAGIASFELSNAGTELHELVLLRKADGTTESFDELLALPEELARTKVEPAGAAFAEPGEEGVYAIADLQAGEYLAICFIPVGALDEESEANGPPHFTQGMKTEFTVS
jgi:hypothetical protein